MSPPRTSPESIEKMMQIRTILLLDAVCAVGGAFWFVDLEIDAGIAFCSDDFEKLAHGASGLSLATNHVSHVFWLS